VSLKKRKGEVVTPIREGKTPWLHFPISPNHRNLKCMTRLSRGFTKREIQSGSLAKVCSEGKAERSGEGGRSTRLGNVGLCFRCFYTL
jgi:hypothetical protein